MIRFFMLLMLTCVGSPLWSKACFCTLSLGPEIYSFKRLREGGTHQHGWISGTRIAIDRIKRYGFYFGADFLYASGELNGATQTGRKITSEMTDEIFELRFGYTLQQQEGRSPFFVPFLGWGKFKEVNAFFHPSPLPCTFTDTFSFWTIGFLSGVTYTPILSMGINFKLRLMQNGQSEVSDDPKFDNVTLLMKDEMHLRLDLPFALNPSRKKKGLAFLLNPFFEYRHFGGKEGFPFNFKKTQFYLYGAHFAINYRF